MVKKVKILFLADTHLGFDMPLKPRIERRRRGDDFFSNYELALQPALMKQVDLVLHGGDMFFRSRVHPNIVNKAFQPLLKIAENHIPVFLVPGNHERSWIPASIFDVHPLIHIFEKPKTYFININGLTLALAGFPHLRKSIRRQFKIAVEKTGFELQSSDIRLLCMHQIVEGAQVGIQNYTFRTGDEVISGKDFPASFHAVLAGHIHRWQVLRVGLDNKPFPASVLYPGAIERTSFAEREEKKGYIILEIEQAILDGRIKINWNFVEVPTRPMVVIDVDEKASDKNALTEFFRKKIAQLNQNSIVNIRFHSKTAINSCHANAAFFRSIVPETMNIEITFSNRMKK
jgi:DNA repair exonuclease SbcCD nuclease subunit